jgi:LacI family transcriptional regulator
MSHTGSTGTSDGEEDVTGRVTLADVARIAGVSLATASRALGDGPRKPSEELRHRVIEVAERLHYAPDPAARAVARGTSTVVGLIVHDISDPYFATIASIVLSAGEERDLLTVIADSRRDPDRELKYFTTFRHQRARAIIVAGSRVGTDDDKAVLQRQIDLYVEQGGRVVLISPPDLKANTVTEHNAEAARTLALALCDRGYRDFAVIASPPTYGTANDRLAGFRAGLDERAFDLHADRVFRAEFTRDGGFEAAKLMIDSGTLPECVFAVNDMMALGAMAAFRDAGIRVPEDVAIAGFDDIVALRDVQPALTTVHIPVEEVARTAVGMVLGDVVVADERRTVDGWVVLRDSTPALAVG